jgi:hypothetical protein
VVKKRGGEGKGRERNCSFHKVTTYNYTLCDSSFSLLSLPVVQLTSTTEMSDENSATKKGMADPLPLLAFHVCNLYGSK